MDISYRWLSDYIAHDLSPDKLAHALTMSGLEVESVTPRGPASEGVVVGHVEAVRAHPNADKLVLCDVNVGTDTPLQVVCGAPNVAAGQRVPLATVGTTLRMPDGEARVPFTLEEVELRGEASQGMICSAHELELSDDHEGILVLPDDAPVGTPLADYLATQGLALTDYVLDIAITPNRPDAVSHIGVARDVAALTQGTLRRPDVDCPQDDSDASPFEVTIDAPDACPRYVGLRVTGVTVGESPAWLQQRLTAVGLRPRNNVVDVTNYVMYECGQPLHAFDYDRLGGPAIRVGQAEGGETFTTLDDVARDVPAGTLLICDAAEPVALAGIMGGANSEVTDGTTDLLIESAYFDPVTIRKAAKALQLATDSSYRFERGVDADGQVWAAFRAAALITELAGGTIDPDGFVDAHPRPQEPLMLDLRVDRVTHLLGAALTADTLAQILSALGFRVVAASEGVLHCEVPLFRPDVRQEIDLIEEVARIYGYDQIPTPGHTQIPARAPQALPSTRLRAQARTVLTGTGHREIFTNSMLRKETAERFNHPPLGGAEGGTVVETLNPISREMAALRPTLLPGMLDVLQFNHNHGQEALHFFELGHVFRQNADGGSVVSGYAEHEALLIASSGPVHSAAWDRAPRPADVFDIKGVVDALLRDLRVPDVSMEAVYEPTDLMQHHLAITAQGAPIGIIATLTSDLTADYDLEQDVCIGELDWAAVIALAAPHLERRHTPVQRYPVVARDLAVVVDDATPAGAMLDTIRSAGKPLLNTADVFDLYQGEGIPEGQKSLAFTLRFGADRTLTDAEVDAQMKDILQALQSTFDAELRG
ncbi:MAG: phenylalanine--tRNA ligase subunit beta [Bacteroidetes bacterium]|jgi:phenylalanyl-tRNA synthetase beta chain|nr:phenylalanine--tRNA ligase subunit beta [Bacteroidota bacterium]